MLAMKPFWKAGKSCFSWVDEPYESNMARQKSRLAMIILILNWKR